MKIQNLHRLTILSLLLMLLSACSSEDDFAAIEEGIDDLEGAIIKIEGFQPGDAVSRSSWVYGKEGLVFTWDASDKLGLYPTALKPTKETKEGKDVYNFDGLINPADKEGHETWAEKWHPSNTGQSNEAFFLTDPTKQQQTQYNCAEIRGGGQYAKIEANGTSSFIWDIEHEDSIRWTVYTPYNPNFIPQKIAQTGAKSDVWANYDRLPFDFSDQTQIGYVNMGAFYRASGDKFADPTYQASEEKACTHLGKADVLISAETKFAFPRTVFDMRHLGSVARFFLLAPAKDLTLVSLRLICDKKIFYTKGYFDLTSHEYVADATKGLCLEGDEGTRKQMHPDETTLTNNLLLNFDNVKTLYSSDSRYGNYLIAYLLMYPITYNPETDGNLFAYVEAYEGTDSSKKLHFVSEALAAKTMKSSYYYQWTARTHEQEGLYPIELTATLLPWQNIVGEGIETDLEK